MARVMAKMEVARRIARSLKDIKVICAAIRTNPLLLRRATARVAFFIRAEATTGAIYKKTRASSIEKSGCPAQKSHLYGVFYFPKEANPRLPFSANREVFCRVRLWFEKAPNDFLLPPPGLFPKQQSYPLF